MHATSPPAVSELLARWREGDGGLSIQETAELLDLSPATIKRHWATARVWLHREMSRETHA